jgi:hypothetical protein
MLDLFVDLVAQIVEPIQILAGLAHAALGLAAALLVLGDPRGLLQKEPQILGRASMMREIIPCSMMA